MAYRRVAIGTVAGALVGVVWAVAGSGGYETGDVALGTGLMGALAGLVLMLLIELFAALVGAIRKLRRRRSEVNDSDLQSS